MTASGTPQAVTNDHFAAIVESSTDAIIGKDIDGVITSWNPAAERTYGYTEGEAVGSPISMLIPGHRRGEERRILDRILAGERLEEYETERVRKDGVQIVVSLTISPVRDVNGEIVGASVIARDVTRRHRSRALAERLQELTSALAGQVEPGPTVKLLLQQAVRGTGADAAAVGVVDPDGEHVELIGATGHSATGLAGWDRFPVAAEVPMSVAIRTGESIWIESAEELERRFPALQSESVRFRALAVVPLTVEGSILGSLSLSFAEPRRSDPETDAFLSAVAGQAADALERTRLREAERRTTGRLAFLAEASELLSESLSLETTLAQLAELTVDRIADWCTIELIDPEGRVGPSTVAHKDPERLELAKTLRERYPPDPEAERGAAKVLRTGAAELHAEISDELLEAVAQDAEHLRLMRELGMRSVIAAPLTARGRILGAMTVVSAESGHDYGPGEVRLVSDLARRAALAIDNSLLFEREHEAAVTLQRSLLPQSLPEVGGLRLATRYEPAAAGLEVGGDWYEVVLREDGQVGVTIGDVAGRGIRAASVMGHVRQALRAYVLEGHGPGEAVGRLNRLMRESERPEMVTLFHLLLDPASGEATYVRAGHPPAVILRDNGDTETLMGEGAVPVGILDDPAYPSNPVRIPPRSLLLLYTDGLIERRSHDLDVGLARLRRLLAEGPRDAEGCLDWLAEQLRADEVPDDVAMLAVSR